MARPDKQAKQQKRAQQQAEVALARGRLADAADALLALAPAERAHHVETIAQALASEQERLLRAAAYAELLAWCKRAEREPKLLPAAVDGAASVRWCWLIAAIKTKQWARARSLLSALESSLDGSPDLAPLRAVVEHEGNPPAEVFASAKLHDVRLGYDDLGRSAASHSCPATAGDVVDACVACMAAEPWQRFRSVVSDWLAQAPEDVAREIRLVALALSRRELLIQARQGAPAALEVARFCAILCTQAGAPPTLLPLISLCVKVAARFLAGTVTDKRVVESCVAIAGAALSYEQLAEPMEQVVLSAQYRGELVEALEPLFRSLIERRGSPAALLKFGGILALRSEQTENVAPLAPWLVQAFERALGEAPALARALTNERQKNTPSGALFLLDALPLPLCLRAILSLFAVADESAREKLSLATNDVLSRMKQKSAAQGAAPSLREVRAFLEGEAPEMAAFMSDLEIKRYLATAVGKLLAREVVAMRAAGQRVPEAMREQVEQLSSVLLPYNLELLDEALRVSASKKEKQRLVARYWARRPRLEVRFDAVFSALVGNYQGALDALSTELLLDYQPDSEDSARALLRADRAGAPKSLRRKIAEVLLGCTSEVELSRQSPRVADALLLARSLVRKRAPAAKPRGPKKAPKAPARSKRGKASPIQFRLFEEGSESQ